MAPWDEAMTLLHREMTPLQNTEKRNRSSRSRIRSRGRIRTRSRNQTKTT